jgi:hypothetical protein
MDDQDMRQRESIPNRADCDINGTGDPAATFVAADRPSRVLRRHEQGAAELILGPTKIPSDRGEIFSRHAFRTLKLRHGFCSKYEWALLARWPDRTVHRSTGGGIAT